MGTLTIAGIKAISEPGRYIDGDGLMLRVTESGFKNWILRVRIEGERRGVGLGSFKVVTLAEAREKAREYRRLIAQGSIPSRRRRRSPMPSRPSATPPPPFTLITRLRGRTASTMRSGSAPSKPTPSR